MPSTINGIGTTYYGKANRDARVGVCESCRKTVQLESYETRLWFVVLFIPIIPLGKKQIIDYCPACTRHRAIPLAEWQRIRDESIREAVQKTSQSPDDPHTAIELHGTLTAFSQRAEAEEMARLLESKFPANAEVQFHLGAYYEQAGRAKDAEAYFLRAQELAPGDPACRRAAALTLIDRGEVDKAWPLVMGDDAGPPTEDASVFMALAAACRGRGDAARALTVLKAAVERFPDLAKAKPFRKLLRDCERAAGSTTPLLPHSRFPRRPALIAAAAAFAVIAGLLAVNSFLASRQPLFVINGLESPMTVTIDGGSPLTLKGLTWVRTRVGEGKHRAVTSWEGLAEDAVEFSVENTLGERWGRDGTFVLNPGGAGALLWEETVYASGINPDYRPPYRFHLLKPFMAFRGLDYAFEDFPKEIRIDSHSSQVSKCRVAFVPAPPVMVLDYVADTLARGERMTYAEGHVRLDPNSESLLDAYTGLCPEQDEPGLKRMRQFLRGLVKHRPVNIELHRSYQHLCRLTGDDASLAALYDDLLRATPGDSALLYLRGRACGRWADAMPYYDQAIAADAKNPYPWLARGYRFLLLGELTEAREMLRAAAERKSDDHAIANALFEVRMALGEQAALETELRAAVEKEPLHLGLHMRLVSLLAAQERFDEAETVHRTYVASAEKAGLDRSHWAVRTSKLLVLQAHDYWPAIGDELAGYQTPFPATASWQTMVAIHQADESALERLLERCVPSVRGSAELMMSAAFPGAGTHRSFWEAAGKMGKWRDLAVRDLGRGSAPDAALAAILDARGRDVTLDEVDQLECGLDAKVAVLIVLAQDHPARREEFLKRARRLNISWFPYQRILNRAIDAVARQNDNR